MNLLQRTLVATVLLGVSGAVLARGAAELVEPDPIAVPKGTEASQVVKAIKLAVTGREWSITKEEPGYIEATLSVRKHMMKYGISYGRKEITFKYLDSSELNYKERDGQGYIHPKANAWAAKLRNNISSRLLQ